MATTMKDVARLAGVDVSTVSLAINNDPRIRIETRERILLIAHDLSYRKNMLARGLRSGKSFTVGAIVDGASSHWNEVLIGAHSVLRPRDYHILVDYLCDDSANGEASQIESLKAKRIDGFLISPANERGSDLDDLGACSRGDIYKVLRDDNVPFVFVDRRVSGLEADLVGIDNSTAVQTAVDYLTGLRHRKIAYLYAPCRMNTAEWERLYAYDSAIRSIGTTPVRVGAPSRGLQSDVEAAQAVVIAALQQRKDHNITALIAANDTLAFGALKAMEFMGLTVPRDFSVVSIGGAPETEYARPNLTTLTISMRQIGAAAATLLYERIQGDLSPYREIRLQADLTVRGSCAAPLR